ncbi:MAG: nucleoside triphosphate pyrophosphohydrolase [Acidobacteria bacterium]|nr:nucleoside triphosphate pyrophosphohydrolase [Acidobacteriota bacterium]
MGDSSIPPPSDQPSAHAHAAQAFARLLSLMAQLRAENGCPWDREQTFDSIKPYTLEETYEVLDAIDRRDFPGLCEELGDFVLQAVFHAQMASEQGLFTIADSLDAINEKLVRRHPHIFADSIAETSADVKHRWDEIKKQEKAAKGIQEQSLLDGVLRSAPALVEAQEISKRAAKVGFDWPDISQVAAKVREELDELAEARDAQDAAHIEEEFGDLLFSAVNLARFLHVDAEQALRKANAKFRRRFAHVEHALAAEGKQLKDSTLDEMEAKWIEAKQQS